MASLGLLLSDVRVNTRTVLFSYC